MSKIIKYDKLVRDKIPERLKAKGIKFESRIVNSEEYSKKLLEKLVEEVEEFSKESTEEELADILEVIKAIIKNRDFSEKKIEKIRIKKLEERGGFKKGIILEKTEE